MIIIANGDSQTFGHGLSDQGTDPKTWPGFTDDVMKQNFAYALANSWPAQLAQSLGCQCVNISRPGGSNDRIVRTTLQYLAKHGAEDTMAIIGWTMPSRRELHVESSLIENPLALNEEITGYKSFLGHMNDMQRDVAHDLAAVKWAQKYTNYGWDDVESHVRFYSQILLLSAYFKQHSIPYLYFSIANPHFYQKNITDDYARTMTQDLYNSINWQRDFIETTSNEPYIFKKFKNYLGPTMHLTLEGHALLANGLEKALIKRKIIAAESPKSAKR